MQERGRQMLSLFERPSRVSLEQLVTVTWRLEHKLLFKQENRTMDPKEKLVPTMLGLCIVSIYCTGGHSTGPSPGGAKLQKVIGENGSKTSLSRVLSS